MFGVLQKVLYGLCHLTEVARGFEALYYFAIAVNEELGKVPLDLTALLILWIDFAQHSIKNGCYLVAHIEARESLLALQVLVQRDCTFAVDIHLSKLGKLGSKLELADFVDLLNRLRSLSIELIAGEVQDLKTLLPICFI